jgi:type IV pilus modification protein PilV
MVFKRLTQDSGKPDHNEDGFTIIEVLIAMVILSIGILGLTKMQIAAIKANGSAMKFTNAAIIAQNQIEVLMITSFDAVTDSSITTTDGYNVEWKIISVIDFDGDGNNEIKNINVVVKDPGGKKRADISFLKSADV